MNKVSKRRAINGILILDKAIGISSNGALQEVKHLYNAKKAGHTGSLDPLATGVLPLCFGEATKFSQYLLDADKRYEATIKLGIRTASGDAEGEILEACKVDAYSDDELEKALDQFRGAIEQIPSMYSALKVNGQTLYKLARKGIEIERAARPITIHQLDLLSNQGDVLILDVLCSKGTYIRTLAEDLGKVLGCGAHVSALRRTQSGPFHIDQAIGIDGLRVKEQEVGLEAIDTLLFDASFALEGWNKIVLSELSAAFIMQGQAVQIAKSPTSGWVKLFKESNETEDEQFIGVGEIMEDGKVAPRRLVAN
ncbi:MAG: tRNA pseudouridine55 synthase [Flavobacterium sp.]|jgi:tRNA pseudouridine55 synthase